MQDQAIPPTLPEPASYYRGADAADRIRTRNAVVFLRTNRAGLQQKNFANRVHHRHVLILVLEGGGGVSLDGELHRLKPQQALLVMPYQFHHYIDLESEALRWLFITFELQEGTDTLAALRHRVLHPVEADLALWRQVVALWRAGREPLQASELLAVLDQLLTRLIGRAPQPVKRLGGSSPAGSWISRVEALLCESVMQGKSLAEVARTVGLS